MRVDFTVYGEPVGKGRPKFSRQGNGVRTYTPEKTANYETLVRYEYENQCRGKKFPDDCYIDIAIRAYFSIPKSASKKRQQQMKAGEIRPAKKPDLDNIVKAICDSLNTVAYKDDSQVISCNAEKWYSEQPRVEIELREVISEAHTTGVHVEKDRYGNITVEVEEERVISMLDVPSNHD